MGKPKRPDMEFRYYELPKGERALALLGDRWKFNYANSLTCRHFHNLTEIGFCHSGSGTLQCGETDTQPYRTGTFTVFPANVLHGTISETPTQIDYWEYLFLDIPALVGDLFGDPRAPAAEKLLCRLRCAPYVFQMEQAPELGRNVQAMLEEMRSPSRDFHAEIFGRLVETFLFRLAALCPLTALPHEQTADDTLRLQPALAYVSLHYSEQIRIAELAAACHLSETHFRRLFGEVMRMTPLDYLNLERIQHACALLQTTNDSVALIAEKTGFLTQTSFIRCFQKYVGTSPYQWKKEHQKGDRRSVHFHITAKAGWR